MNNFRIVSALLVTALFGVACGDDKGDDTGASTTTNTTPSTMPSTMTETNPTSGTTGGTDDTGVVDPDTTNNTSTPTSTTDPTMTTDPTEDPTAGPSGMYCAESCAADGDCTLMGMDLGYTCQEGTCGPPKCADDNACTAQFSGWAVGCASQAECPGQACINPGDGMGKCATVPSDFFMCNTIPGFADAMFPAIEGGMDITVCANTSYTCNTDSGQCENPCDSDAECLSTFAPICNTDSGACECGTNEDCATAMVPGLTTCNSGVCGCGSDADCADSPSGTVCTSNGFCGCASDAECADSVNADKCYDGVCGCSDSSVCTMKSFDGTTQMCESF